MSICVVDRKDKPICSHVSLPEDQAALRCHLPSSGSIEISTRLGLASLEQFSEICFSQINAMGKKTALLCQAIPAAKDSSQKDHKIVYNLGEANFAAGLCTATEKTNISASVMVDLVNKHNAIVAEIKYHMEDSTTGTYASCAPDSSSLAKHQAQQKLLKLFWKLENIKVQIFVLKNFHTNLSFSNRAFAALDIGTIEEFLTVCSTASGFYYKDPSYRIVGQLLATLMGKHGRLGIHEESFYKSKVPQFVQSVLNSTRNVEAMLRYPDLVQLERENPKLVPDLLAYYRTMSQTIIAQENNIDEEKSVTPEEIGQLRNLRSMVAAAILLIAVTKLKYFESGVEELTRFIGTDSEFLYTEGVKSYIEQLDELKAFILGDRGSPAMDAPSELVRDMNAFIEKYAAKKQK